MTKLHKLGDDIVVGDILIFCHTPHMVAELESYYHPTIGEPWLIARASDGWAMSIIPDSRYEVA